MYRDEIERMAQDGEKYKDEDEAKIVDERGLENCSERIQERDVGGIVGVPVPQAMEENVEVVELVPRDEVQDCALGHVVVELVPRVRDESVVPSNADASAIDPPDPGYELSKKSYEMGVYDEIQVFEHGCRQRRLGETRGVRREMTEEVVRFVPRERISDGVEEQIVFLNGRWVTVTGGDDEYIKKLMYSSWVVQP